MIATPNVLPTLARLLLVPLLACTALVATDETVASAAQAGAPAGATITVTTLADTVATDGVCSLREAVANADADGDTTGGDCAAGVGADTIVFSVAGTVTLANHLCLCSGDTLTVDGGDAVTLTGGDGFYGILVVANATNLTLRNLTLSGAVAGAVQAVKATLTVEHCTFSNNHGIDLLGTGGTGGITDAGAQVTVSDSTFTANHAVSSGGAITVGAYPTDPPVPGTLVVRNSTFTDNTAGLRGGAIDNGVGAAGTSTIIGSTFTGNSAQDGGAMTNDWGSLTIANSTIVGNTASEAGGGLYALEDIDVAFSTLSANSAPEGDGGQGNGDDAYALVTDIRFADSILGHGTSGRSCDTNSGALVDLGHNIDDSGTCDFSGANGSLPLTDPRLDPAGLAGNGGPTETVALCVATGVPAGCEGRSPAIDLAADPACATAPIDDLDQRGVLRPDDGDGDGTAVCDAGSYEAVVADRAPIAVKDKASTIKGIPVTIYPLANDSDPDLDQLWLASTTQPKHGVAVAVPGTNTVIYIPRAKYSGPDAFTYTVGDRPPPFYGALSTATVHVSVLSTDHRP